MRKTCEIYLLINSGQLEAITDSEKGNQGKFVKGKNTAIHAATSFAALNKYSIIYMVCLMVMLPC